MTTGVASRKVIEEYHLVGAQPHPSGDDRYRIYSVSRRSVGMGDVLHDLADTSQDGIGLTLVTLRDEEQITNDTRVGILDRETRQWLVNPWAKGDRR